MADGKTYWFALDAAWLDRDAPDELGDTYGPAGPLTLVALMCAAKLENDAGRLRGSFRVLAKRNFTGDSGLAREIVEHAASIGALDDLVIDSDGRRFSCRISGWQADQRVLVQRRHIPNPVRRRVLDRGRCASCGTERDLQIDHIEPWSLGGSDHEENLQALCGSCNRRKGARRV